MNMKDLDWGEEGEYEDEDDSYFYKFDSIFQSDPLMFPPGYIDLYAKLMGLHNTPSNLVQDGIVLSDAASREVINTVFGCPLDMVDQFINLLGDKHAT